MQGQTIITTHDVDELFISTIVRLIERRAFPNLQNIIAKTHSADIVRWFPRLRTEAKRSLFKILVEEKRMGEVLRDMKSADISHHGMGGKIGTQSSTIFRTSGKIGPKLGTQDNG